MLRIDLLPEHFAQARAAKGWLVIMGVLLVVVIVGCFGWLMVTKSQLAAVKADLAKWDEEAKKVEAVEAKAGELETLAKPIDEKVNFIEDADKSGEQFWAAFDKVNRYVYSRAHMLNFTITPPDKVQFAVEVPDTTTVGRFVLDLIRCPDITGIQFGGTIPAGPGVGPAGAAPAGGGGGAPGGMPGGMAGGAPGAMPGGGMPGGGAPGAMPGGMPGMTPGMPGAGPGMPGGGARGGGAPSGAAGGAIRLTVQAQLVKPINVPAPGGGAAAAGGAPGMPGGGGMPGMPGAGPGMSGGGGMPGMPGGMPGKAGPGGKAGAKAGGKAGAKASEDDSGGGSGPKLKRGGGGGDEG